jgi:hypothetical protein
MRIWNIALLDYQLWVCPMALPTHRPLLRPQPPQPGSEPGSQQRDSLNSPVPLTVTPQDIRPVRQLPISSCHYASGRFNLPPKLACNLTVTRSGPRTCSCPGTQTLGAQSVTL